MKKFLMISTITLGACGAIYYFSRLLSPDTTPFPSQASPTIVNSGPAISPHSTNASQTARAVTPLKPDHPYLKVIKKNYPLSDEAIQKYLQMGLNLPALIQFSELSKMSGKSVDELIQMKTSPPRGWGKVLRDLKISRAEFEQRVQSKIRGLPNPYRHPQKKSESKR